MKITPFDQKSVINQSYETPSDNPVLLDRSAVEIQDDCWFRVAYPENDTDESDPRNDPSPHSKPEMMAALHMNAKLSDGRTFPQEGGHTEGAAFRA